MSITEQSGAIALQENGPLIVSSLRRLRTADGEELAVTGKTALCRCGGSATKPFCDGSHKTNGFTGARETVRPLDRYRGYVDGAVAIEDNRTICSHAEVCIRTLPTVFRRDTTPWIAPDGATAEEIVALTHRCPSGALVAVVDGDRVPEPARDQEIVIARDGPYEVGGGITLRIDQTLRPPVPERYTLCRCGASANKPYCDGSHHRLERGWGKLGSRK